MGRVLKIAVFLVAVKSNGAYAQRYFDPWGSRFEDNFGFLNQGLQPCPEYQPMRVFDWEKLPTGDFLLRSALPGVRSNARHVWLDRSGSALHIKAARPVPLSGRRCLPSSARVSSDGRFEVYETSVPLPLDANAAGGTIKQTSYGIDVLLPRLPTARSSVPKSSPSPKRSIIAQETHANPTEAKIKNDRENRHQGQLHAPREPSQIHAIPAPMPQALPEIPEGVEVIDIEPEESLKNPDATEGWYDNRGEFQLY